MEATIFTARRDMGQVKDGELQRCCLPSETYGRNGATPIFRYFFHITASFTTGGWSRWNI